MKAKEWLGVMKQARDFPKGMEKVVIEYGEMLLNEKDYKDQSINQLIAQLILTIEEHLPPEHLIRYSNSFLTLKKHAL
jgi:hypothetical protein